MMNVFKKNDLYHKPFFFLEYRKYAKIMRNADVMSYPGVFTVAVLSFLFKNSSVDIDMGVDSGSIS